MFTLLSQYLDNVHEMAQFVNTIRYVMSSHLCSLVKNWLFIKVSLLCVPTTMWHKILKLRFIFKYIPGIILKFYFINKFWKLLSYNRRIFHYEI